MQGFNMGRYYPPDHDPRKATLNQLHGKHPLGDRARKLDQGILIVRFELPFNIWCGGCDSMIGQGVRYNAEKKKVGNYYSTPIWGFRCKCHLCSHWFEIRTDPKNARYVVESGARQKVEEWDPAENGGFAITEDPTKPESSTAAPPDAFAALEKSTEDKSRMLKDAERLEELEEVSAASWSDPYTLSSKLRKSFREEKHRAQTREAADERVRRRIGWDSSKRLVDEDEVREEARSRWLERGRLTDGGEDGNGEEAGRKRPRLDLALERAATVRSDKRRIVDEGPKSSTDRSSGLRAHGRSSNSHRPDRGEAGASSASSMSHPPLRRSRPPSLHSAMLVPPSGSNTPIRRHRVPADAGRHASSSSVAPPSKKRQTAASKLTSQILQNTSKRRDPFLASMAASVRPGGVS